MGRALGLVQQSHVDTMDLSQYDLLVCNATLDVNDLRERAPDATLACYACDMLTVPAYGSDGGIYGGLRQRMAPFMLRDGAGNLIHGEKYPDQHYYELTFDAADAYVEWIRVRLLIHWGALYLDNCYGVPSRWFSNDMVRAGLPADRLYDRWPHFREYFLLRLKKVAGRPIIGNVGCGPYSKLLDAYTLERWHVHDRLREIGRFVNSAQELSRPDLNVAWEWDPPIAANLEGFALRGEWL
jgi:hypothetical protein